MIRAARVSCVAAIAAAAGPSAQADELRELYRQDHSFVGFARTDEMDARACVVRLSNGPELGAITFYMIRSPSLSFSLDSIFGHELGTGATHGARKGDAYEVHVDGELLAAGRLDAGVAPYEGDVDDWPGSLLDALAYGAELTWGFPEQEPLIAVSVTDNDGLVRALSACRQL